MRSKEYNAMSLQTGFFFSVFFPVFFFGRYTFVKTISLSHSVPKQNRHAFSFESIEPYRGELPSTCSAYHLYFFRKNYKTPIVNTFQRDILRFLRFSLLEIMITKVDPGMFEGEGKGAPNAYLAKSVGMLYDH